MIPDRVSAAEATSTDGDDDLLTRAEASGFLALFGSG